MATVIERLAKKKETTAPLSSLSPLSTLTILPVLKKEHDHEGACGSDCGCGEADGGGCCGG